jgi:hypothetical protein
MAERDLVYEIFRVYGSRPDLKLWRSQSIVAFDTNGRKITALPKGFPDISGIRDDGRAIFIEVKSPTGKLSAEQERIGAILLKFKALYCVARCLEDVEKLLIR